MEEINRTRKAEEEMWAGVSSRSPAQQKQNEGEREGGKGHVRTKYSSSVRRKRSGERGGGGCSCYTWPQSYDHRPPR